MTKLVLLGTSNAVPSEQQDSSHMILIGANRVVLIDVSTNPIIRLQRAKIDPLSLTDVILTHFHPDHVSGVPILLLDSWLLGRKQPLNFYGLAATLDRVEKMMDLYGWQEWPGFFPVNFIRLPVQEMAPVLQSSDFNIFSSPVHHMVPNIGIRVEIPETGESFAYSCDTEPCPEVVVLARGVDYLLHEATGAELGHSSPEGAGKVAAQAGVKCLMLIHYDLQHNNLSGLIAHAKEAFSGPVELAKDFQVIEFK